MTKKKNEEVSQKNLSNIAAQKLTFKEEVSDSELHSKLDFDDHIYVAKRGFYGFSVLIFLSVILFLVSLFSMLFGTVYLSRIHDNSETNVSKYNLIISHSDSKYGGNIDSFSNYNSSSRAFKYRFGVSNSNSIELKYIVEVINNNYDFTKMDMSLINYRLVKNDVVVKKGTFKNAETNTVYKAFIKGESFDEYTLEIWSGDLASNSFSFKVNVGV